MNRATHVLPLSKGLQATHHGGAALPVVGA